MRPWFEGVVTWAHRRRALVFAAAACLLALSAFGLRPVTFDAFVLPALLQRDSR